MPTYHLIRPDSQVTFCGISKSLINSAFTTQEGTDPQKHDIIGEAVKLAGGLEHVCSDCVRLRVFPWSATHGQTSEDELADDDEYWKTLDAKTREKTVD